MKTPKKPAGVPAGASWVYWKKMWRADPPGGYRKTGEVQWFSRTGVLQLTETYKNGNRIGPYKEYWPGGALKGEGNYRGYYLSQGVHVRHAPPGGKEWQPFPKVKVAGSVRRASGRFANKKFGDFHYFDKDDAECTAKGRALTDTEKKKKKPKSAQEKLAALIAG